MKKIIVLMLVLVMVVLLAMPAFATSARYGLTMSQPLETTDIFVDEDGNDMDYGVWVYGSKLFADENNSFMGIYNADTEGECTNANMKEEIGEATMYDTKYQPFAKPQYFSDGVYAIMTTGVGWIEYGAQP